MAHRKDGKIAWGPTLDIAANIVRSYSTPVSLRQVFYRLVGLGEITNTLHSYNRLARNSAKARREGRFPPLVDHTRDINRPGGFDSVADALDLLAGTAYRRTRNEDQPETVWLIAEKRTLVPQFVAWTKHLGAYVVALSGYGSEPLLRDIRSTRNGDDRPAHLLYVGDLDPTGWDIPRHLKKHTPPWASYERLAVNLGHVSGMGLAADKTSTAAVKNLRADPGKAEDPRTAEFVKTFGSLMQIEVEAIDPDDLKIIVMDAVTPLVDKDILAEVMDQEELDIERLMDLAEFERKRLDT